MATITITITSFDKLEEMRPLERLVLSIVRNCDVADCKEEFAELTNDVLERWLIGYEEGKRDELWCICPIHKADWTWEPDANPES